MPDSQIVAWEDEGAWLGYLRAYPDHWTQGETREELETNLEALRNDIESGEIPGIP